MFCLDYDPVNCVFCARLPIFLHFPLFPFYNYPIHLENSFQKTCVPTTAIF